MSLAQTGECEIYARIEDFSNVSGDAVHYMEIQLATVPQANVKGEFIHDRVIREYFDVTGKAAATLYRGLIIYVSIPTVGLKDLCITLPDRATYNITGIIGEAFPYGLGDYILS